MRDSEVPLCGRQRVFRNVGCGHDLALVGHRLVAGDVRQLGNAAGADDAYSQLAGFHCLLHDASAPSARGRFKANPGYFSAENEAGSMKVLVTPATMGPSCSDSASMAAQAGSLAKASHWRSRSSTLS